MHVKKRMGGDGLGAWPWVGRMAVLCLLAGIGLGIAASPAQAIHQRKVGVGFGLMSTTVKGDLDGQSAYVDPGTGSVMLNPKLDPGSGFHLYGGVPLNDNFALEALILATAHDASHQATVQPMTAAILSYLLGGRVMVPFGDSMELFGRAGLGTAAIAVTQNASVSGQPADTTYGGGVFGYGGGISIYIDPLSFDLSVYQQRIKLNTLTAHGPNQDVSGSISSSISTSSVMLTAVIHFGSKQ